MHKSRSEAKIEGPQWPRATAKVLHSELRTSHISILKMKPQFTGTAASATIYPRTRLGSPVLARIASSKQTVRPHHGTQMSTKALQPESASTVLHSRLLPIASLPARKSLSSLSIESQSAEKIKQTGEVLVDQHLVREMVL